MMQPNEYEEKSGVRVKTYDSTATKEIAADCNLPDYLPDVNRLLRVSAKVTEFSKYLSGDLIEYDGRIRFDLLYATGAGEMRSMDYDTDFSGDLALSGASGDCEIRLEPQVSAVSCRLQNPRKLTAKAKLEFPVSVYCRVSTEPTVSGRLSAEERESLQYRRDPIESVRERLVEERNTPVSEDVELDPGMPAIAEIVSVELMPSVADIRLFDGKAVYKGEVVADILYRAASGEEETAPRYVAFLRRVPIYGEIASEQIGERCVAFASVETEHLEFRPQENASGEARTVELDFDYSVHLRLFCNEPSEIVSDLYSPDYESENTAETLSYETVLSGKVFNFSADGSAPREDRDFDRIVSTGATAKIDTAEKQGGKLVFTGTATVSVVLENGAGVYLSRSFPVPFRAQAEVGRVGDAYSVLSDALVLNVTSRLDETQIHADLELLIPFVIFEQHERALVRESAVYPEKPLAHPAAASMTLYYPAAKDSLWEIAKRYGTTVAELTSANGISSDTVPAVMVIPKHTVPKTKARKLL